MSTLLRMVPRLVKRSVADVPTYRVDLMPYGGVKASGFGHEGPKYAVREMSEERLITFSGLPG